MVHPSLRVWRIALGWLLTLGLGFAQSVSPPATITGFSDSAWQKDGQIEVVEVVAKLDVRMAGNYRLIFRLTAGNGKFASNEAAGYLETGSRTLISRFRVKQIEELGQDGPYRISDARLVLQDLNTVADSKDDAGPTQAYRLADLYHERYYFIGDFDAAGIDPTADGKFTALRLTFGVALPGGRCAWWVNCATRMARSIWRTVRVTGRPSRPERMLSHSTFRPTKSQIVAAAVRWLFGT